MTIKDLFEEHNIECKNCTIKDKCDGIHVTIKNTTKCERFELKKEKTNV